MSVPLSEQQLADIHARDNAATKGPWCTDGSEIYTGTEYLPWASLWIGETCRADEGDGGRADAAFIAHAREDVPALLAEVERLRAERDQFADRIDKLTAAAKKRREQVRALKDELSDVQQRAAELERALNAVDTAALDKAARLLSEDGEQS